MAAPLKRRLGLYGAFSVSIGAMIGSGIFVLPGLAFEVGGPSVMLAYAVAGAIVLPAALAQSEMATAMPRAGGAYLYIDLAMGPMMGTIAGLGVWFSLVFKSAFALDGLGLYLGHFMDVETLSLELGIGVVLIAINLIGIKETGSVQAALVTVVFVVLLVFLGGGATLVDSANYHPFFPGGSGKLLAAAALVFVSYAGVTKVASVAEEVANPARNIPVAIISSLLVMTFIYPAVTYVMVGVTPPRALAGDLTPLVTAGEQFFPGWMVATVAVIGVLALASMTNAGLLASSRYPFAMARRRLVPHVLAHVGRRSGAPSWAILLTGIAVLGLVATLPVLELAKLASAFQLLILALINIAQIAFRSSKLWWYRPKFRAPGYPVVPVLGVAASGLLITQLGIEAILGAVGIVLGGLLWYQFYGRSRAIKESAFRERVRQQGMSRLLRLTEAELGAATRRIVAVAGSDDERTASLHRVARALSPDRGSEEDGFVRFDPTDAGRPAGPRPGLIVAAMGRPGDPGPDDLPSGSDVVWLSDTMAGVNRIAVLGSGGPLDVLKIWMATRLAEQEGASIRFVHVLDRNATRAQVRSLERFHREVGELCGVPTESMVLESEDLLGSLTSAVSDADVAIVGSPTGRRLGHDLTDRMIEEFSIPVLLVRVATRQERPSLRRMFDRIVARRLGRSDATHGK